MKRPAEEDDQEIYCSREKMTSNNQQTPPAVVPNNCLISSSAANNSNSTLGASGVVVGAPALIDDHVVAPIVNGSQLLLLNDSAVVPTGVGDTMAARVDKVAILDCGAQYGKVIDRRVRELCIESELLPLDTPADFLKRNFKAIIISGGPRSVYAKDALKCDAELFRSGLPILGICYGLQLINLEMGGTVEKKAVREDGEHVINIDPSCSLFKGLKDKENVLLTHGDSIGQVASGFKEVGRSGNVIVAIADESKKIFGVQFHPEVDLTANGRVMLKNFLINIAQCLPSFTMRNRELHCIEEIQQHDQSKTIVVLCSGGVDSTVCAALLRKALPKGKIIAIHIDNGFMRKNESIQVRQSLQKVDVHLKVFSKGYIFYNAKTEILNPHTGENVESAPLCKVCDPETKRKIIGDTFIRLTNHIMKGLQLNPEEVYVAQGTLRPDLIESASALVSGKADAIKTHHNDTPLVRLLRAKGRVIEPLKDFHKDEVRQLGRDLNLPETIIARHPFPGPGLAIRILCRTDPYICNNFNETQSLLKMMVQFAVHVNEVSSAINKIKACFSDEEQRKLVEITKDTDLHSTLLPIQAVGVQGDSRTYSYVAAISTNHRPVPWSALFSLARFIPKALHNINRVTYVFGSAVLHSILDVTPTLLTKLPISIAQEADHVVTTELPIEISKKISQLPVILLPVHFDRPVFSPENPSVQYSICLRPFITNDFMTGVAAIPGVHIPTDVLDIVASKIIAGVPMISRVLYDLTSKPPATTEWE